MPNNDSTSKESKEILGLLVRLQRNNQFVVEDYDTGLSIAESSALLEIDTHPHMSLSELGRHLDIDVSTAKQITTRLKDKKLLCISSDKTDKRLRRLLPSADGKELLKRYDDFSFRLLDQHSVGLSKEQLQTLEILFTKLADSGCPTPGKQRANDAELRLQMRRLTIAFGLLHRKFRGTEITVAEWQVLSELQKGKTVALTIIENVGIAQNYLSQILKKFVEKKYLNKEQDKKDKRRFYLTLTKKGEKALEAVNSDMRKQIDRAIEKISKQTLEMAIATFRKFVAKDKELCIRLENKNLLATSIHSDSHLNECRVFYVKELLKTKKTIPELLFPASLPTYALKKQSKIIGAVSYCAPKDDIKKHIHFAQQVSKETQKVFLNICLSHARRFYDF